MAATSWCSRPTDAMGFRTGCRGRWRKVYSAIPTLFIAPGARGFVDQVSGDVKLKRVLMPIDVSPPPGRAIEAVQRFARLLTGANIAVDLLHVGEAAPPLRTVSST